MLRKKYPESEHNTRKNFTSKVLVWSSSHCQIQACMCERQEVWFVLRNVCESCVTTKTLSCYDGYVKSQLRLLHAPWLKTGDRAMHMLLIPSAIGVICLLPCCCGRFVLLFVSWRWMNWNSHKNTPTALRELEWSRLYISTCMTGVHKTASEPV